MEEPLTSPFWYRVSPFQASLGGVSRLYGAHFILSILITLASC